MAYTYNKKTAEERKEEIDTLTDKMNDSLRNYAVNPLDLKDFLRFMDKFRDYSLKNQLLIRSQYQGAYGVASFKTFKEWGLSVLKGEKGIKIFVPVDIKQFKTLQGTWKNIRYATKEEKAYLTTHKATVETRKRLGFKLGTVFDVTQTNAKPEDYPTLFPNRKKVFHYAGENLKPLKAGLLTYAAERNISVKTEKIQNSAAKGYYRPDTRAIILSDRNNESESLHTLIHELAHAVLHNQEKMAEKEAGLHHVPVIEYQAEMTAYLVAHHFGLDTEAHSLQYTAQWTKNLKEVSDLTQALEETRAASYALIGALELILENELGNSREHKKNPLAAQNTVLTDRMYAIQTIEPIAQIGTHMVYDMKLDSESTETSFYRILTTKTAVEIAQTWTGEKSGADWVKENALTAFIAKHPEIISPQEKIATLEKNIPEATHSFESFIKKTRASTIQTGLTH